MFKIEKGVPMPARSGRTNDRGRAPTYPLGTMEVGDSFVVIEECAEKARVAAAKWRERKTGWRYSAQKQADGSHRIWRIS